MKTTLTTLTTATAVLVVLLSAVDHGCVAHREPSPPGHHRDEYDEVINADGSINIDQFNEMLDRMLSGNRPTPSGEDSRRLQKIGYDVDKTYNSVSRRNQKKHDVDDDDDAIVQFNADDKP